MKENDIDIFINLLLGSINAYLWMEYKQTISLVITVIAISIGTYLFIDRRK